MEKKVRMSYMSEELLFQRPISLPNDINTATTGGEDKFEKSARPQNRRKGERRRS